jgi:hypothetical protein
VIDADDPTAGRVTRQLFDRDPGAEADLEHAIVGLHVEQPHRPHVALAVRFPVRHDPARRSAAHAVGAVELPDHCPHRLLLESHDLIQ